MGYTNAVSAKSGAVTSGQSSSLETTVTGAGTLTFRWKVLGGMYRNTPFAYAKVELDGTECASTYLESDWAEVTIAVEGVGDHVVRWTYLRTSSRTVEEGDCAWVDALTWTPAASFDVTVEVGDGKEVVVPAAWFDAYGDIVAAAGGDKAAALMSTAANGRKVWECFMLGVDPTAKDDDFRITSFRMENGKPVFEFSHTADGNGESFVSRIRTLGKAKLTDDWQEVPEAGDATFRFFTVEVELP